MPVVIVIGGVAIDVITALAILIAAYAAGIMLIRPLAWLLGNLPLIGRSIADALNNGAQAFMSWAQDNAKNAVGALVAVVSSVVYWVQQVVGTTVSAAEYVVAQILSSIQRITQVANQVSLGLGNMVAELGSLASRVAATAASIAGIAGHVAAAAVAILETRVVAWVDGLHAAVAQAIDTAHVELGHAIDGVNLRIHAVELGLTHAIDIAVTGVQSWVNLRLRPIESDIGGIQTWVESVPAVATIVGTITAVQAIEKVMESCVKPTCSGLGPSLDILNAIADGAALAEMLALVSLAAHDPEGAAREITGVVNAVEGTVKTILAPAGIAA